MIDPILGTTYPLTILLEPAVFLVGFLSVLGTWWLILRGSRPIAYFALVLTIFLPFIAGSFVFVFRVKEMCWILSTYESPQPVQKIFGWFRDCLFSLELGVGFTFVSFASCTVAMCIFALRSPIGGTDKSVEPDYQQKKSAI